MAFPTTRWTLVRAAAHPGEGRRALTELLTAWWPPVYAYVRRRGLDPEDAEDAVQDLFAALLAPESLARVDPARGRLRNWLLGAVEHQLGHRREKAHAAKRAAAVIPLDTEGIEAWLAADERSPEEAFQRAWADGVLQRALAQLRTELDTGGRVGSWSVLARALGGAEVPYRDLAAEAGMSIPQLKSFVHRARARLRELALVEVRETVGTAQDADAELAELLGP